MYWYDSCGNQQSLAQSCSNGCYNNSCQNNNYNTCTSNYQERCSGNSLYWYDSDVPLGVWASGGVDSSTILHYAAEQSESRLKTFSISFRGRSFDESEYFREVADVYGTDHHEFDLNPETELESAIENFAYYSDEPSADAGACRFGSCRA